MSRLVCCCTCAGGAAVAGGVGVTRQLTGKSDLARKVTPRACLDWSRREKSAVRERAPGHEPDRREESSRSARQLACRCDADGFRYLASPAAAAVFTGFGFVVKE